MKRLEVLTPTSLEEALRLLASRPEAVPVAGGTDLLPQLKDGRRPDEVLLRLKHVPETRGLACNGTLRLGSTVTVAQIAADSRIQRDFNALAVGASLIGSVQIRNVATVGGNLCNAAPSADTAPPLLALDAQAVIAGAHGERTIPLESFFRGPGRTALQPGELLKEIIVPQPSSHSGSSYVRHTPRKRMDLAVVGVAAAVTVNADGTIEDTRLALGAVASVPMRAIDSETLLRGQIPTDGLFEEAGDSAAREAQPIDDLRASAEYRRHLVRVLTVRALRGATVFAQRAKDM